MLREDGLFFIALNNIEIGKYRTLIVKVQINMKEYLASDSCIPEALQKLIVML